MSCGSMCFSAAQIQEAATLVWDTMLEGGLEPAPQSFHPPDGSHILQAHVELSGGWDGCVHLFIHANLARTCTAFLLDISPSETTLEDMTDAIGELVNIIAGRLKLGLEEPTRISVPYVVDGGLVSDGDWRTTDGLGVFYEMPDGWFRIAAVATQSV